jgi:NAD(P)-dependent dehydrogenase (short-subunit alcohol dehydrogenase family)
MASLQQTPVWFITGCSTGFGRELAQLVLARGWRAVVTARDQARVEDLAAGDARDRALALSLDVCDSAQIAAAVQAAQEKFGRIDVLVNNAGYGYMTSIEEGVEEDIRAQFDANVFGLFAMTRAVLPVMRAQRSGHVISITSVAGYVGYPGSGYYAASKHAVEGWSDSLAVEGKPLGIKVSCVAPGPSRTDWAGRSMTQTPNAIADYADTVGARLQSTSAISGHQAGDPVRIAQAVIDIAEIDNPPRHFVLGAFGVDAVTAKLRDSLAEIEAWREKGVATDFPKQDRGGSR